MNAEQPFQTFERIYGRSWPGGDAFEIVELLFFFGITAKPGSEEANLLLQQAMLRMQPPAAARFCVDEKSYDLAEHFLSSRPDAPEAARRGLAQAIQDAAEDWCDENGW